MVLGALVDAGLSLEVLSDAIAQMGVSGVSLECEQAQRGGLTGTFVRVNLDTEAERTRNFNDFIEIVGSSSLSGQSQGAVHSGIPANGGGRGESPRDQR